MSRSSEPSRKVYSIEGWEEFLSNCLDLPVTRQYPGFQIEEVSIEPFVKPHRPLIERPTRLYTGPLCSTASEGEIQLVCREIESQPVEYTMSSGEVEEEVLEVWEPRIKTTEKVEHIERTVTVRDVPEAAGIWFEED
ncbi:hypothetical protein P9112_013095 [Eukaryota sp. TZLM1-RC]